MSTTITGKLNKAARIFQAGESTGFGIRLGVKYRDPKTKQDEWTNYSAVVFAKAPGQIQFYRNVLVEGAVVEIMAEQLRIDSFQGDNGAILSIDMLNAKLGYVFAPQVQQQPQQGFQQQAPQQQFQQQAPTQQQQWQQASQQQRAPQQQQAPQQNYQNNQNQSQNFGQQPQPPVDFDDD